MVKPLLTSLYYLPPVSFFKAIKKEEDIWVEKNANYTKRTYANRVHLATAHGQKQLSIPLVKGKHQNKPYTAVQISYIDHWQRQHWHTIQTAYGNAPFFEFYADELKVFYTEQTDLLFDFNLKMLHWLLECLQLEPNIHFTETYEQSPENHTDFRNVLIPNKPVPEQFQSKPYPQLFEDRCGYLPNLSILDLLFCAGPEWRRYCP